MKFELSVLLALAIGSSARPNGYKHDDHGHGGSWNNANDHQDGPSCPYVPDKPVSSPEPVPVPAPVPVPGQGNNGHNNDGPSCPYVPDKPISSGAPAPAPAPGQNNNSTNDLSIQTTSGLIHGMINETSPHVRQFLGIPFAQPPVDSLRWLPPRSLPSSASKQQVQATALPPSCMQFLSSNGNSIYTREILEFNLQGLNRTGAISEDCLTLSVWAPTTNATSAGKLLPVEIFIYGGGFVTGGQDVPYQLPPQWVERTRDHIVVSMNYRVNIFGFPNAAGLSEQNLGLQDQRLAVEWIRDNIASFGGDPFRMLLWGQSAGSASVDYYNYAYPTDPIVSAFSMDSGTVFIDITTNDPSHSNFTFVANSLGCNDSSSQLDCMRSLPASTIENFFATYSDNGTTPAISFLPSVDEKLVFSNYTARAESGLLAKIPAIIGTNAQDGVPFTGGPYNPNGPPVNASTAALLSAFFCPATYSIKLRQQQNVPTYRYVYAGNFTNISPKGWMGAYHSSELPMLFGTYDNFRGEGTELEMQTSVAMQDAWVAITAGGTEGIESTGWKQYTELGAQMVREFGGGVAEQDVSLSELESMCDGPVPKGGVQEGGL